MLVIHLYQSPKYLQIATTFTKKVQKMEKNNDSKVKQCKPKKLTTENFWKYLSSTASWKKTTQSKVQSAVAF